MKSFEENVAISKKVAETAHAVGLSVEAELGTIGKTDNEAEDGSDAIIYTDPLDAVTFVQATGVDSLAVAIGTYHGRYPKTLKPELKHSRAACSFVDCLESLSLRVAATPCCRCVPRCAGQHPLQPAGSALRCA